LRGSRRRTPLAQFSSSVGRVGMSRSPRGVPALFC
jgi:hypothetical protein